MSPSELHVNLFDLVHPLTRAVDMMNPALSNHHSQVGYLAYRIAEAMGLSVEERRDIAVAGVLHDIGGFSLTERLDILKFEDVHPGAHAVAGYLLLHGFRPLSRAATLIRFHHHPWDYGAGLAFKGESVPLSSHIVHLADRVAVLISKTAPILSQVKHIMETIESRQGAVFCPEAVDALGRLSSRDFVWLEATANGTEALLRPTTAPLMQELTLDDLLSLSHLICRIIDFKSAFTATHSSGVAASALALATRVGFSAQECKMMEMAAYLHDVGKLAIPSEILEKPAKLDAEERNIMRTHAYFTYHILQPIEALQMITSWGALHQERLNGTGYPFGYTAEQLPLGSRVMAVADVFTAITEDRPYRRGMTKEQAIEVLEKMVTEGELDERMVHLLLSDYDAINFVRSEAQRLAVGEYEDFQTALTKAVA